ncbi:MAG TPA: PepSY domain-containing protein [Gammaproteobacteria bacterium]|nr:PepSY domain-containing protein [Gammaproteobacteria bacterium]
MPIPASRSALAALLAIALLGAARTGAAQRLPDGWPEAVPGSAGEPRGFVTQLPQRRELTLAEAITMAQGRYPGRVVRAQTIQLGNGAVHEIRIIGNDGLVHVVRVDARTGAVK